MTDPAPRPLPHPGPPPTPAAVYAAAQARYDAACELIRAGDTLREIAPYRRDMHIESARYDEANRAWDRANRRWPR